MLSLWLVLAALGRTVATCEVGVSTVISPPGDPYTALVAEAPPLWNSLEFTKLGMSLITPFVLWLTVTWQLSLMRRQKTLDFADAFMRRWDEIRYVMLPKVSAAGGSGGFSDMQYFQRYWNLQFDQFHAWRTGNLLRIYYEHWMLQRHSEYVDQAPIGTHTYREGWDLVQGSIGDTKFVDFMNMVLKNDVDAAFKKYPPEKQRWFRYAQ